MSLSRLLQPKFNRYGFSKPIRWFTSQSSDVEVEKSSQLKKTSVPREQRAVAAESFVKKYMKANQGVFPKASHIQNEVGGSWFTVKAILHNIKEKMLGTPQLENHHIIDASAPAKETTSSAFMTSHSVRGNGIELYDHADSVVHADQVLQTQDKDGNIGHSTSMAAVGSSSAPIVDIAASDVTNMHCSSGSCELQTPSTVQGTKSGSDFHASETVLSENVELHLSRKYNSEGMVQLNAVMDSQYVQPKELVSNMSETSDCSLGSSSEKLSHFEHDKLNSTGCEEQQENKTMSSVPSPNSSVEMSPKSTLPNNSQKVSRLADVFKYFTDDAALAEAKNGKTESEVSHSSTILSYGIYRNSKAKSLLSTDNLLPNGSINKWQDLHVNKSVPSGFQNQRPVKQIIECSLTQNVIPNMAESFTDSRYLMGFGDMKRVNNQTSEFITNTKKDVSMHTFFGHVEKPAHKDEAERSEIKQLIECIKGLPGEPSIARPQDNISSLKTNESNQKSQLGIQSLASLQNFDKKEIKKSSYCHAVRNISKNNDPLKVLPVGSRTQGDETSGLDCTKQNGRTQVAVLTDKQESNDIQHKFFTMEEPGQNKAVVKFLLRNTQKSDIINAFRHCGDILKVEILSSEQAFYKTANIYFQKREGLQNALEKTDMLVRNANITVEAAASGEDISNRISIPSLIGDPNVPASLVKNPTRTVKITRLTRDISSHDVVAALASCESNVTGFFFGALDSVAYLEFETEDGKEIALAKHSIDVLGKRLLISRIDAPRTTIVRISYHHCVNDSKVIQVCKSLGKIKLVSKRWTGIMDVHFKLREWPNMLKILNRLNAVQVDGHRLLAQPASVFPPDILQILWSQPEERKYVKTVVQKLLQKLGENVVHKAELTDLADFY